MVEGYSVLIQRGKKKTRVKGFTTAGQLELFCETIREEFPQYKLHLVSHTTPTKKPFRERPPARGLLWCPYCGTWRKFKSWYNYNRCEICGISNAEFHVRKANDLFDRPTHIKKGKR